MKQFKHFITEASTTDATNEEMAIVYVYNRNKGLNHDKALSEGGIKKSDFKKFNKEWMLRVAQDIYKKNFKTSRGKFLHMAEKSGPNYYTKFPGVGMVKPDNTSKTDFYGDNKNRFSLKQADDSKGAQLMSGMPGEAAGTVLAGVEHLKAASGKGFEESKEFKDAIAVLNEKMMTTIRSVGNDNPALAPIGDGKKDLGMWYIQSARFDHLKTLYGDKYSDKDIQEHLKAELKALNVMAQKGKWESKFLEEIEPQTSGEASDWISSPNRPNLKDLENIFQAWTESSLELFPKARTDYTPKDWNTKEVREHLVDLIRVSSETPEWKAELNKFFDKNKALNRWIVFEAASGWWKFTGPEGHTSFTGKADYKGDNWRVANRILKFSAGDTGKFEGEYSSIIDWSKKNTGLVKKLTIDYKGSGVARSIVLRIPTNESLIHECIDMEMETLCEDFNNIHAEYLAEGFVDLVKGLAKKGKDLVASMWDKLKEAAIVFYERVIKRFINMLIGIAKKGYGYFLDALGLQANVKLTLGTVK